MTATSILEIDVRDDRFRAFNELFNRYQSAVEKLPGGWSKIGEATDKSSGTIADMTAALMAQNELLHRGVAEQDKFSKAAASGQKSMAGLATSTKDVAKNIGEATTALLKWASITGAVSGLLGAGGGLFGITRLAQGVSGDLRRAQGLGATSGDTRAFTLNYDRYFDANGLLDRVTDAQSDQNKRWAFGALGIKDDQTADPVELSMEVTRKAKEVLARGDGSQQYAHANGLDLFFDQPAMRRLNSTSNEDLDRSEADTRRDAAKLSLRAGDQKLWQDFSIQMQRAGETIQNTFVRDLTPLAPALTRLSEAFTGAADAFLSNPHLKEWMGDLAGEVDKFATWLKKADVAAESERVLTQVGRFGTAMGNMATMAEGILVKFGVLAPPEGDKGYHFNGVPGITPGVPNSPGAEVPWYLDTPEHLARRFDSWAFGVRPPGVDASGRSPGEAGYDPRTGQHTGWNTAGGNAPALPVDAEKNARESWDFWKGKGLSDEAAAAQLGNERGESGMDPRVRGDSGTAGGSAQWHDERRRKIRDATGIDVWTNFDHRSQLEAMYREQHDAIDAGAGRAWANLHGPISIRGGVTTLVHDHERSADQVGDIEKRFRYAQDFYDRFHKAADSAQPITPGISEPFEEPLARPSASAQEVRRGMQEAVTPRRRPEPTPEEPMTPPGRAGAGTGISYLDRLAMQTRPVIDVRNNTGGSAIVSASLLPQ